ncbi:MAG: UDP-N-acetylmuramate--L-alanine ligase [Actinomycetota bacterium]|nr:UDP-N-acetylmuramate--L-alanine ligase [Actinomycetota bacterium]MDH5224376.1 UDP-N-acetylmuramate--L-alanine ligase [Actinomycetota bacterium]MDH5313441.1 UDP-N-acetylmuramate--L-alanine ligase [Actinomycetota bacterium]
MPVPTLDEVRSVHMIGIGGAGMRNLARLMRARGIEVRGSDIKASKGVAELRAAGADVWIGHDPDRLGSPDVVITSSAIHRSNPELRVARERGITVWARQQALVALAAGNRSVAVAGTHGKTTTTSMIAMLLERAGLDPSYLIGGDLNESGSGARSGQGELFVFEADESDGSFLLARPHVGVVTNVDVDHVDFYPGGREEIEAAFGAFVTRCQHVVACGDDPGVRSVLADTGVEALRYGTGDDNDLVVSIDELGPDGAAGRVRDADGAEASIRLRIDGAHNVLNAAAAVGVAQLEGVSLPDAAAALGAFAGVHRRFERRGSAGGAEFYDDYGHTPTEMAVTIATARRRRPGRLIALVQPHRYSRVQALWRELGASVAEADLVLVTDIYGAAQEPIPGVTGKLVVDGVRLASPSTNVVYLPHRTEVVDFLEREVRAGDLVVTMGCGDVWMLGDAAIERLGTES